MNAITMKNRAEIVEKLAEMLMDFDKGCNEYETDIYLYYDEATETAELDTFVNVGGNSWLNDDHITIYRDKPHTENMFDWYQNISELAEYAEISEEKLTAETREYHGYDEDDEVDFFDVREYIKSKEDYMEKLSEAYDATIDECKTDYIEKAENIISEIEES